MLFLNSPKISINENNQIFANPKEKNHLKYQIQSFNYKFNSIFLKTSKMKST